MLYTIRYLFYIGLLLLFVTACSSEPEEALPLEGVFSFSIDPQTQTVGLNELNAERHPQQVSEEPRPLTSQELMLENYSFHFLPDDVLKIEARFNNRSSYNFEQPFSFTVSPEIDNIISSTEPTVSDADLGGDGVLSPGEVTGTLVFEVKHKNEPFRYFVGASAKVTKVLTSTKFIVNTTEDLTDANPGDGLCKSDNGLCSMRAAIEESNALPGANTIILAEDSYPIEGEFFEITEDLSMEGVSQDATVIATLSFFFEKFTWTISEDVTVSLRNLTLRGLYGDNGNDGTNGIENFGTLTLEDVTITDNYSSVSSRAGIVNRGGLSIVRSTISRNGALPFFGARGFGIVSTGEVTIKESQIIDNEGSGISSSGSLLIEDSLIEDNFGVEGDAGGGVGSSGNAIIRRSTIQSNRLLEFAVGGGIYNSGTMFIEDSLIDGNSVSWGSTGDDSFGGGIYNAGTLRVVRSTISNNEVSGTIILEGLGRGGGLYNSGDGSATLINSTLSNNGAISTATPAGGGIYNLGNLSLVNSTLNQNRSEHWNSDGEAVSNSAGALYNGGSTELKNTIVANSDALTDCENAGTLTSKGNNLSGDASCGFNQASDLSNTDPLLGPLADNGGLTQTHALLAGSPAIDTGSDTGLETDQRGVARPQGAAFDIGAFEKD